MSDIKEWEHEVLSEHPTAAEAKRAGYALIELLRGTPPGWVIGLYGADDTGWKLVKYRP